MSKRRTPGGLPKRLTELTSAAGPVGSRSMKRYDETEDQ